MWRSLTVAAIGGVLQDFPGLLGMTVVDAIYFDETVGELRRTGITVHHFTLVADPKTIRRRMLRPLHPRSTRWALRQVQRCTNALQSPRFATHLTTDDRSASRSPRPFAGWPRSDLASGGVTADRKACR